jgi:hypothetical protein
MATAGLADGSVAQARHGWLLEYEIVFDAPRRL